jgi:hypothetical protein
MKTCENCGCLVYELGCVNCNEVAYIEAQDEYEDPRTLEEMVEPDRLKESAVEKSRRERRVVALTALNHLVNVAMKPYADDRHSQQDLLDAAEGRIQLHCGL